MPTRRAFLIGATAAKAFYAAAPDDSLVQVRSVPSGGIQPQIVAAGRDVHLLYFAGDPKHGDIFYARSHDLGASFSAAMRVNSQPGSAIAIGAIRGAQIALGKDQRVHVAWNGSDAPHSPMLYTRQSDQGSAFETQRNLMRKTFGLDGGGSLAADPVGNVYVAWHGKAPGAAEGEAGRKVWIARSADSGGSFADEQPVSAEPTGACGCCAMRLFGDSHGTLYGLYRSATQDIHRDIYLLCSADQGRDFAVANLHPWEINACPMSSMAFMESRGEVFGAWETQGQVYFAPVSRGVEAAKGAIRMPPGDNPRRKYPALAGNRRGDVLLAWVEGAGWQRGGTLGWQIFDPSGRPKAACQSRTDVPVWSFPAVFARPDGRFTILA